jgi:hypothetical protein
MADNAVQVSIVTPIPTATVEPPKQLTLTQRIDADEGLKAKRKLLTVVSLILLAIAFSGAKVVEANTFIMKVSFTNQNGIAYLLLLSIAFLMVRYYNYARQYHDELYKAWTKKMLQDRYFYSENVFLKNQHQYDISGLVIERAPSFINLDTILYEDGHFSFTYNCSKFFRRGIKYRWAESKNDEYRDTDITVGWKSYFKVLFYEVKYQASSFFTHRENLDILAPYLLGCFSILSFIFNKEIIEMLKGFSL